VGYGEGGILTEAVRRKPYCVILLDEMEKAHPDVMELFYQVFDKGRMEDAEGREIDFRHSVILMTSNTGADIIRRMNGDGAESAWLREALGEELRQVFKPALLSRLTVVPYLPIGDSALRRIVELKLEKIGRRLRASHQVDLAYSARVVEEVANRCTEVDSGARNVDHILTDTLLPEVSSELLARMVNGSGCRLVRVDVANSGGFRYTME
jgi:type VI secretion system protein VasG